MKISGRSLTHWYYVGLGGLWWSNILDSALLPQMLWSNTWLEHHNPASHLVQKKRREKNKKKKKKKKNRYNPKPNGKSKTKQTKSHKEIHTHKKKKKKKKKTAPRQMVKAKLNRQGTSLVVQWLRICLPVQGRGFDPWSGRIPHAAEQLSLCATSTEPAL